MSKANMFKFVLQGLTQLGTAGVFKSWDLLGRRKVIGASPWESYLYTLFVHFFPPDSMKWAALDHIKLLNMMLCLATGTGIMLKTSEINIQSKCCLVHGLIWSQPQKVKYQIEHILCHRANLNRLKIILD